MINFLDFQKQKLKRFFMALHPQHPKRQAERLWRAHKRGWVVMLTLLMVSTVAVKENATNLQLSLLSLPSHAPFDGTVMPIQSVPDWVKATDAERHLTYNEFPGGKLVATPSYVPSRLREDMADLDWSDPYDDHTRNMKITYSVPYAGTYKFDGIEGIGSHPGVDIKSVKGTPVYAIANGVVEKLNYSNAGFGNLIVVRHDGVPDPDDPSRLTTLHSGYAHLNDIFVTDGAVLTKGQLIGTVGDTGTATTDHLHFQIDNDEAPWHLYWPFTSSESNAVGGFWQAINVGLNQDKLYENTVNPMDYVQRYADPDATYESSPLFEAAPVTPVDVPVVDDVVEVTDEPVVDEPVVIAPPSVVENSDSGLPFDSVHIEYDSYLFLNDHQEVPLTLLDEVGELVKNAPLNSPVKITVSNPDVLRVTPDQLTTRSVRNGLATIGLYPIKVGESTFTVSFLGENYFTGEIVVPSDREPLDSFALETDHHFFLGQPEPVVVVALNKEGQRLTHFDLDAPVTLEVVKGEGFFSRTALLSNDFEQGLATVNFTSTSDEDVVLKVHHGDLASSSSILSSTLFGDVPENHAYYQAISYLKTQGVIQGYDDDTFRPDQAVSRVEALKLLYLGLNKEVVSGAALHFPDTDSNAWYAPYVSTAQRDGAVKGYPDGYFRPGNEVNRVELIKMLIGVAGVDVDPVVIGDPFSDVHYLEWYAPYAQFVKDANVAPWVTTKLEPSRSMTRGDVAEMIYRVLALQQNGAEKYSRTLVLN